MKKPNKARLFIQHVTNPITLFVYLVQIVHWYDAVWRWFHRPDTEPPLTKEEIVKLSRLKEKQRKLRREISEFRKRNE